MTRITKRNNFKLFSTKRFWFFTIDFSPFKSSWSKILLSIFVWLWNLNFSTATATARILQAMLKIALCRFFHGNMAKCAYIIQKNEGKIFYHFFPCWIAVIIFVWNASTRPAWSFTIKKDKRPVIRDTEFERFIAKQIEFVTFCVILMRVFSRWIPTCH